MHRLISIVSVLFVISGGGGGGRGGGGVLANSIGCYVSHEHPNVDVGFEVPSGIMNCDGLRGVLKGEKVDLLSVLEHKDSYPAFFVKANIDAFWRVKDNNPTGLVLQGPLLYEQYFNSKDDLECYKMVWNCTTVPVAGEPTWSPVKESFRVSKYGVALKGRSERELCPKEKEAFESCKVLTCSDDLCNDGVKSKGNWLFLGALFIVIKRF